MNSLPVSNKTSVSEKYFISNSKKIRKNKRWVPKSSNHASQLYWLFGSWNVRSMVQKTGSLNRPMDKRPLMKEPNVINLTLCS